MLVAIRKSTIIFVGPVLLCVLASVCVAQSQANKHLDKKVASFELSDVPMSLLLERLAKTYQVPIGLETIPKEGDKASHEFSVRIEEGTVRDVLEAVIRADPRYKWEEIDGVINVSPKTGGSPILEIVVSNFRVDYANRKDAGLSIIQLPEVKARLKELGLTRSDFGSLPAPSYDDLPRFSLRLRNVSVRRILNEIMKISGSSYWVFSRYGDRNEYFLLSIS